MRRLAAMFCASLVLAGLLLVPLAAGVSAATASAAGFACDPHGTTGGSPTTKLSTVTIDTTTPANSTLTCLFRGTRLPASFGGTCHFGNGTFLVDFARRVLLPVNNNTNLICSGATSVSGNTDLSITKDDGVTSVVPGTDTTYTITVSNAGPNPVSGATVTDAFPAASFSGDTYTAAGAGGASGFTASGSGNIADTVTLPVGGTITYTVTALVNPSATGTLANTASVAMPAGLTDPTPGNNSATDTDTLTPVADIAVTLVDGVTSIPSGGSTTWTMTVTNNGPSTAHMSFSSISVGPSGGCTFSLGTFFTAPNATLTPGATSVGTAAISAVTGPGTVASSASASATETDPNPGNNSASDTDTCTP